MNGGDTQAGRGLQEAQESLSSLQASLRKARAVRIVGSLAALAIAVIYALLFIGLGKAKYYVLTGKELNAPEAERIGLVDRVFEPEKEGKVLAETIKEFLPLNPDSLELSRRLLNESFSVEYEDFVGHFLAAQDRAIRSKAFKREVKKAHKKRAPAPRRRK